MTTITVKEADYAEITIPVVGTAPILVAHRLQWDVPGFWDDAPPDMGRDKAKALTAKQRTTLDVLGMPLNGALTRDQETFLRGHWLPTGKPAFPTDGFMGAIDAGARTYQKRGSGRISVKKLAGSLRILGDDTDVTLAALAGPAPTIDEDIGTDAGRGAPRLVRRLRWEGGEWHFALRFRYIPQQLNADQIAQLVLWAGYMGIGQGRPSAPKHPKNFGTFAIDTGGQIHD